MRENLQLMRGAARRIPGNLLLEQLNEIAEAVPAGSEGRCVPSIYVRGEIPCLESIRQRAFSLDLIFAKTKGHMVRACMEGVAFSLRHNLEVAEAAGAKAEVSSCYGRFSQFPSLDSD